VSRGLLVDTSAWQPYFRVRAGSRQPAGAAALADRVDRAVVDGDAVVHPVVAGEVLLGGVDPRDAFDGLEWLDTTDIDDLATLAWLAAWPTGRIRGVGWADCVIVHGAVRGDLELVTADGDQQRLYDLARSTRRP
jgi:hypothetical protein